MNASYSGVRRFVAEYCNASDKFVAEHELQGFNLAAFQVVFSVSSTDPMFDCWQMTRQHTDFLDQYIQQPIHRDFSRKTYFVEASTLSD